MSAVIKVALGHLGTHDGWPFVKFLGLPKGSAWCLAFALFCWHEAAPKNTLPRTGRCYIFWTRAQANPARYRVITPEQSAWGRKIRSGDVAIFSHNPASPDWNGHAALVISDAGNGRVNTIEGNTSPTDKGDQRMGNTVALKVRRSGVSSFLLKGFVRQR